MDSKDEVKIKKKSSKTKKDGKKKKSRKGRKASKKSQFVSVQAPAKIPSALGGTPSFGAGGLGSVLSALGITPKFQGSGGVSGFALPAASTLSTIYRQPVAPKLEEKVYVKEIVEAPSVTISKEENMLKKLEKAFAGASKEQLRDRIFYYFGGNDSADLDYVIQDEILKANTKRGLLSKLADFASRGFGNINIDEFISFEPFSDVGGESASALSVPAFGGGAGAGGAAFNMPFGGSSMSVGSGGSSILSETAQEGLDVEEDLGGEEEE